MSEGRTRPEQLVDHELKERWKPRLHGIEIPDPFDLTAFCEALAEQRGRPIRLLPFERSDADAPSGLWVQAEDADYIYFESDTTRLHQQHIVLHEIGHMLAGHLEDPSASASYRERYLPNLEPAMLRRILGRTSYTAEQEQEAEWFARELGRRISAQAEADNAGRDAITRAQAALGGKW